MRTRTLHESAQLLHRLRTEREARQADWANDWGQYVDTALESEATEPLRENATRAERLHYLRTKRGQNF